MSRSRSALRFVGSISFAAVVLLAGSAQVAVAGDTASPQTTLRDVGPYDKIKPGAVPEPSTWALMLVGFGGLGIAIRRRRFLARDAG
jgi:hypothetical protein